MKIIQIADLHLPAAGEAKKEEYSLAWNNWEQMRTELDLMGADLIVNTGDICREIPKASIYKQYFKGLASMSTPVINLSGNHDDLDLMEPYGETQSTLKKEGFDFLFLHCCPDKLIPPHQDLLVEALAHKKKPLIIFMHYPPLYAGSPYMDGQYPFADIDTILPLLADAKRSISLFCGHYHMARTIKYGSLTAYITPSPYRNIDPAFTDRVDCNRFAFPFREIIVRGGQVESFLKEAL